MADDEPPRNPFVRFKQHVDSNIRAGVTNVISLSSYATQNPQASPQDPRDVRPDEMAGRYSHYSQPGSGPPNPFDWSPTTPAPPAQPSSSPSSPTAFGDRGGRQPSRRHIFVQQKFLWAFAQYSPYSPLALERELPRQPTPNGLSPDMDAAAFTFRDAFEDLLAAAAGQPMPELRERYELNRALARVWPAGERPDVWASRVADGGLLDSMFAGNQQQRRWWGRGDRHCRGRDRDRERDDAQSMEDWVDKRLAKLEARRARELEKTGMRWEKEQRREEPEAKEQTAVTQVEQPTAGGEKGGGLLEELDAAFHLVSKALQDEISTKFGVKRQEPNNAGSNEPGNAPTTEQEFYSQFKSAFEEADKSLGAMVKSFSEGFAAHAEASKKPSPPPGPASVIRQEAQAERTQSSEREWVDFFGNRHVKTERWTVDEHGNEISRETRYSVQSSSQASWPRQDARVEEIKEEDAVEQPLMYKRASQQRAEEPRKSGWFWK